MLRMMKKPGNIFVLNKNIARLRIRVASLEENEIIPFAMIDTNNEKEVKTIVMNHAAISIIKLGIDDINNSTTIKSLFL